MNGSAKIHIPFNGIVRQYFNLEYEYRDAIDVVMRSGQLLNGHCKTNFEDQIACRVGREYAMCVNSGTNALHYILDWLQSDQCASLSKIWHDHERWPTQPRIGIPNYSFKSTQNSIAKRGISQFVDVDSRTGLIDLKNNLSTMFKLDIIMYVNLYGNMVNYEELITVSTFFYDNEDAIIIEDAAQSFGSKFKGKHSGSFGDFSIFSFDPTKNFGNPMGGGGMILTDDPLAASWFFDYLNNGGLSNHTISNQLNVPAINSGMSEVDCACMLVKLNYFDEWQKRRTEIAEYYNDNLYSNITTPRQTTTEGVEHCYSKYVILSEKRDRIKRELEKVNIETKIHYDLSEGYTIVEHETLGSTIMSKQVLSLPIYPELTDLEVERIVEEVNRS